MNKKILSLPFFIIFLLTPVKADNLIINIHSEEEMGSIIVGVYSTKEKEFFGKTKVNMKGNPEHVYVGAKGILRNYKASISFNIPFGDYAVVSYLDKDNNDVLTGNFLGMPKEPFGFSNNVRGKLGPPKWKDVLFNFSNANQEITINLKR
tara:strand:+ start:14 stop:463 length:450 start_codon:yes stop_codon:yes gene_type:complete